MNIKDKSDLVDASKLDDKNEVEAIYNSVKIDRLQIYQIQDQAKNDQIRVTVYDSRYGYIFFDFMHPSEQMRGLATYAGLLDALATGKPVSLIADGYHGDPHVGFISGVDIY
ncbi:hypothetical protein Xmau_04019 [Xenorhabdus mauleonii]|uniref:Uncharacterized protein n=1 Tax=Xenorhabdus mauleonii TaxID=351675 RepID=A0A1I3TLI7_9GAMM|nr:hypothetical protein [Xenorhabdus mauleonii]PHM37095.1 hypothetical protein Xmau_04019 [Xenorhabdus mauleonii]SFJ72058.1 hypothetical protein SAMN05421680_114103 [Xenorhabdus mauleonii]